MSTPSPSTSLIGSRRTAKDVISWTVTAASAAVALSIAYRLLKNSHHNDTHLLTRRRVTATGNVGHAKEQPNGIDNDNDDDNDDSGSDNDNDEESMVDAQLPSLSTNHGGHVPSWTLPLAHTAITVASTTHECEAAIHKLMQTNPQVSGVVFDRLSNNSLIDRSLNGTK
jgi:hypothetical protein